MLERIRYIDETTRETHEYDPKSAPDHVLNAAELIQFDLTEDPNRPATNQLQNNLSALFQQKEMNEIYIMQDSIAGYDFIFAWKKTCQMAIEKGWDEDKTMLLASEFGEILTKAIKQNLPPNEATQGHSPEAAEVFHTFLRFMVGIEKTSGNAVNYGTSREDRINDIVMIAPNEGKRDKVFVGVPDIGNLLGQGTTNIMWMPYNGDKDGFVIHDGLSEFHAAKAGNTPNTIHGVDFDMLRDVYFSTPAHVIEVSLFLHELAHIYLMEDRVRSFEKTPVFKMLIDAEIAAGDETGIVRYSRNRVQETDYKPDEYDNELFCDALAFHLSSYDLPPSPILGRFFDSIVLLDTHFLLNNDETSRQRLWEVMQDPDAFLGKKQNKLLTKIFSLKKGVFQTDPETVISALDKWQNIAQRVINSKVDLSAAISANP